MMAASFTVLFCCKENEHFLSGHSMMPINLRLITRHLKQVVLLYSYNIMEFVWTDRGSSQALKETATTSHEGIVVCTLSDIMNSSFGKAWLQQFYCWAWAVSFVYFGPLNLGRKSFNFGLVNFDYEQFHSINHCKILYTYWSYTVYYKPVTA